MSKRKVTLFLSLMSLLPALAWAQTPITLQDAVRKAIVSNPEVQARIREAGLPEKQAIRIAEGW